MHTPLIFIVFNRPEVTARVFARIREARPATLYVICDGPRPHRPDDIPNVAAVRAIIEQGVDWDCDVIRDYADTNLGCRHRVASGLTRAFARLEHAIVLEDDCLPDPGFFPYCGELLARYRDDPRVMHIAGTNFSAPVGAAPHGPGYRFSHHPWIWGWATWRRAWEQYDFGMATWDARFSALRASFASPWEAQYWISTYDGARSDLDRADTWGFPWMFTVRSLGGLSVLPTVNLVENIGIGADSTHTKSDAAHLRIPASAAPLPLVCPAGRRVSRFADEHFTRVYCRHTGLRHAFSSLVRVWRASLRAA
ncbi:hemolytic protein HlpA-like protein [Opitutaceae bacterium TAV5]|nr:hemolytic protein HlpA-like protein [Opitutaceae bacterium TAV5]